MSTLRVTYKKSAIGYSQRQKDTIRSLGLRKLGQTVTVPDNGEKPHRTSQNTGCLSD